MVGRSRKKVTKNDKKVEGNTLPSFDIKEKGKNASSNKVFVKSQTINQKNYDSRNFDDELLSNKKNIGNTLPSFDVKVDESKLHKKKGILKFILIPIICIFVILSLLFIFRLINLNISEMVWKVGLTRGSDSVNNKSVKYEYYNNGLMRISNDGLTYINDKGSISWSISYNMKEPVYISKGDNFLVADKNGSSIYLFNTLGFQNNFNTSNILDIAIDNSGIILALTYSNEYGYSLVYFDKNGKKYSKNITNKPIDLDISKNGTLYLDILSEVEDENLKFYSEYKNVSNNSDDLIKVFKSEFIDKFLVRAHFFDDNNSFLMSDSNIVFIDNKDTNDIKIIKNIELDKKVKSISYNDKYLVLIDEDNRINTYDKVGFKISNVKLNLDFDTFYISDDYIIFIKDKRVVIYDTKGIIQFDKTLTLDPIYIAKKRSLFFTELLVGLIDGVQCIRFY